MANLTESPIYEPGIFQLEKTTPPLGGAPAFNGNNPIAGHANVQGLQLANRTSWLKQRLEDLSKSDWVSISDFGLVGSGQDAYQSLQGLLNYIAGTGKVGWVPDGDYPLSDTIITPNGSFSLVLGPNAKIKRNFSVSPSGYRTVFSLSASLSNTPNSYLENISISGGDWSCEGHVYGEGNIFSAMGVKNLIIKDAKFKNVVDAHALDIACFDSVMVDNCKFLGYKNAAGDRDFSEAIQLDPAASFPASFSDTWNGKNVYISRCYFGPNPERTETGWGSWGGGVGNHALSYDGSGVARGGMHQNIYISDCIFSDCVIEGIRPLGWRNVVIENNLFSVPTGGSGVLIEHGFVRPADGSVPENYKIIKNTFTGLGIFVNVPNPPDGVYVATKKHLKSLEIAFNTFKRTSGNTIILSLSWVQNLNVCKNIAENLGGAFISSRFLAEASIEGNSTQGGTTFLYVTEVGSEYIGTGLTRNITVRGNTIKQATARSIHFNGACQQAIVAENIFEDVVTSGALPVVVGDTNARGISVVNNRYRRSSTAINLPSVGVQVGGLDHFIGMNDWGEISVPASYTTTSVGSGRMTICYNGDTPSGLIIAPTGSSVLCAGTSPGLWLKTSGTGSNTGWQKVAVV